MSVGQEPNQTKPNQGPHVKEYGLHLEGNHRRILNWELVFYEDNSECSMKNGLEAGKNKGREIVRGLMQ